MGTDCCKNREVCTGTYWDMNTQKERGIGVGEYGEIDAYARVRIWRYG